MNKRGQITIFMILGIVILIVFFFLIFIVNSTQKANLAAEQAKAFEVVYPKEGVNIYLSDCLKDSLTEALGLLENQGRLWKDLDAGGAVPFEEGVSGTLVDGVPVAYSLVHPPFSNFPHAYPCSSEDGEPAFCEYSYPSLGLSFGSLELTPYTLQDDLQRYLKASVVSCAQALASEKIAPDAVAEVSSPQFAVTLQSNGIYVDATIPLSLVLRGIHYFVPSSFQRLYPTNLLNVVETAAYFPLQADRDYLDFNYSKETLIKRDFDFGSPEDLGSCLLDKNPPQESDPLKAFYRCPQKLVAGYSSLGVEMKKYFLDNGDTLFSFFSPGVKYTFARQNRPPALNYISRFACPAGEYDYLAIARDASSFSFPPSLSSPLSPIGPGLTAAPSSGSSVLDNLGGNSVDYLALRKIDITIAALDPDEQETEKIELNIIDVSSEAALNSPPASKKSSGIPLIDEDVPDKKHFLVSAPAPGRYILRATANDEFLKEKLQDKQDVRVLVDNPIETSLDIYHNYGNLMKKVPGSGTALVSPEDPINVDVRFPKKSLTGIPGTFDFSLTIGGVQKVFSGLIPPPDKQIAGIPRTFTFPYDSTKQPNLIKTITDSSQFAYSLVTTEDLKELEEQEEPGTLVLDYSLNYCGNNLQTSQSTAAIAVVPCLPQRNEKHPFPYPYHNYLDKNKDGIADASASGIDELAGPYALFEANHTCCLGEPDKPETWRIAQPEDNIACFKKNVDENEAWGCFGEADYNGVDGTGYLLEKRITEVHYCGSPRGNTCDEKNPKFVSLPQKVCGNSNKYKSCNLVAKECKDKIPFFKGDGFWCHGAAGCGENKNACKTEIITNVKGLGFANLNDKQYACGCDSEQFGDASNKGNDCWNLEENKVGTCQQEGYDISPRCHTST